MVYPKITGAGGSTLVEINGVFQWMSPAEKANYICNSCGLNLEQCSSVYKAHRETEGKIGKVIDE